MTNQAIRGNAVRHFDRVHGLPIRSARAFNNMGRDSSWATGVVIPDFFSEILAKKDLVLLSDGKPTRTFCYIADAVPGYFKVLLSEHSGEAFNIGVERPEISMLELAETVIKVSAEVLGVQVGLRFKISEDSAYLSDNPLRRCPDISKARNL